MPPILLPAFLQPRLQGVNLTSPLSGSDYDSLNNEVSSYFLSDKTQRLRILNSDGVAVYSSVAVEVGHALFDEQSMQAIVAAGAVSATVEGAANGAGPHLTVDSLLYSTAKQPVATVEVYRDYSATAASIASAQRLACLYVGFGLFALYVVLQVGAWGVTRALAKDHARLTYLYQTGEHVRSSLDLQDVLSLIVRDSALLVQGQYSMVCLVDHEVEHAGGPGDVRPPERVHSPASQRSWRLAVPPRAGDRRD